MDGGGVVGDLDADVFFSGDFTLDDVCADADALLFLADSTVFDAFFFFADDDSAVAFFFCADDDGDIAYFFGAMMRTILNWTRNYWMATQGADDGTTGVLMGW